MIVFWTLYLASLALLPVAITKKKKPAASVAWLLAIAFIPILGGLLFLTFGTDRIVNKGRKKLFSNEELEKQLRRIESEWAPVVEDSASAEKLPDALDNIRVVARKFGLFDTLGRNKVTLLIDAEEIYNKMEQAILQAKDHINLEYYIFEPDAVGLRFRDLLIKKAREGVRINFLYDAVGSIHLGWSRKFLAPLREAGVEPIDFMPLRTFFQPWNMNLRNHRKIMVIDDEIAFTGSLNIGEDFICENDKGGKRWRETHVMIEGPAVAQLQWVFCEDWYFATGEELLNDHYFHKVKAAGDHILQVVPGGPDVREAAISKAIVTAVSQAQAKIYLTTPYFIPDAPLDMALQLAALHGADVRIIVPKKSDHPYVALAGRSYYEDLLHAGVRIFEYDAGFIHAKMLVIDEQFTVIGSANTDLRSFGYNFEANVHMYDRSLALQAEEIFLNDLSNCKEIEETHFLKRPARARFAENFCRLFSALM